MSHGLLTCRLRRLLAAAAHALRHDKLFRYALLGIALSLLLLLSRPPAKLPAGAASTTTTAPVPPSLPPPASLGPGYGTQAARPEPPAIAPGRPLPAAGGPPAAAAPDDGFGTLRHHGSPP